MILAAGGCGMVYRETTNPPVATGDGMAAAYRAGAELRDMEFMQFHPTVLYVAGSARFLISEAVRGEGAYLRDVHGERFMLDADPRPSWPRATWSPAPSSARWSAPSTRTSTSTCRTSTRRSCAAVPRHRPRLPEFGLDITKDRIPVRPGAHYMIGGVTVDMDGPHDAAEPVGGRRGDLQRAARGEPAGVEQPARGAGLRGAVRRGAAEAARAMPDDLAAPPLRFAFRRTTRRGSTWPT